MIHTKRKKTNNISCHLKNIDFENDITFATPE